MKDEDKTREELIIELAQLRREVARLEKDIAERKQAEDALSHFELLAAQSRDMIFLVRRDDGRILEANEASTKAYGYSREQLLKMTIHQLRTPETLELIPGQIVEADLHGILFETVHCRSDGSTFPVEVSSRGETIGSTRILISVVRDIKERKHSEEALRISEERFRKLFEESPIGIAFLGKQRQIMLTNQRYRDFLGYSEAEIMERGPVGLLHPDDWEPSMALSTKLRAGEIPLFHMEQRYIRKDGTVVWGDTQITVLRDKDGQLIHTIGWVQDITERKRVEEALLESESRAKAMLQAIPDLMFRMDSRSVFLDYKADISDLYVQSEPTLIGKRNRDITPPEFADLIDRQIRTTLETGALQTFEYQLPIPCRGVRDYEARMVASGADEVTAIVRDVTERKRAEEALRLSEKGLQRAEAVARFGNWEFMMGRNEVRASNGAKLIYGLEGTAWSIPYVQSIVLPEYRPILDDALKGLIEKNGPYNVEFKIQRPNDGKIVDIHSIAEYSPEQELVFGVIQDVTERKRAEEALRESQERFQELAELLPETIFEMDTSGNLTFVNRNAFDHFGYSQKDFQHGLNGFELVSPEDRPRALENAKRVMSGEKIGLSEYKVLRKDGTTFPAIMHSAAKFLDGKPVGIRGIVIDITETKNLEADLRQALKMEAIGTLAGGIAHDFNNILAAMIGFTEMALNSVPGSSPTRHYLERVLKAAHRAKDLVSQILASSRQTQAQERMPIEIAPVIEEALKLLRASLPATIEIREDIGSEMGVALADPTEVHQVLVNLCTNAAHAMEDKGGLLEISLGEVTINLDADAVPADLKPGHYLRLTVSDTGHGIDPAILDRIFDPYFTTKEVGKGSGLGLAVVHGIAKRHEGAITVNSEPGVGTRFHVYFPKVESMTAREVDRVEKPLPRGTERVLFVDDEEILVEMGKSVLEWLGYEVTVTTNSLEALELFRLHSNHFDAVITDYTMPHMTGADLAKEMLRIQPDIPVILCTGFSEKISEEKSREMGIRAFAMKPLKMRDIAETVRRVLDEK
jgi:PAS domain S-box-containing protein